MFIKCGSLILSLGASLVAGALSAEENRSSLIEPGPFPARVHAFEDYETEIEKRWWLRGQRVTNNVPPSRSASLPNRFACRATESKNFDKKMGDQSRSWKAVIFNPVPGPPMAGNTRLAFRYWLQGSDRLRVQIFSLSKGFHRYLTLDGLPQGAWQSACVDMTQARRPDGSGGALAADERIDDIQFYVAPNAELLIDDIVLYESAADDEQRPFPRDFKFTGWFDTGKQGKEWPGDFEIVEHEKPRTWDAARSRPSRFGWHEMRVQLRGERRMSG